MSYWGESILCYWSHC